MTNSFRSHDSIQLRRLHLQQLHRVGTDAWGRRKEQPLQISVDLQLKESFASAAAHDALDASTVHYGQLAKRLRSLDEASAWETLDQFTQRAHARIYEDGHATTNLQASTVTVHLPKASLLGREVLFTQSRLYADQSNDASPPTLSIVGITIPTVIGVNANERDRPQPLIFDVELSGATLSKLDPYAKVEALLVDLVRDTRYETLESLLLYLARRMYDDYLLRTLPDVDLRLRVEKPAAVPFADAPIIEIFRTAKQMASAPAPTNDSTSLDLKVAIVRPYLAT